MNTSQTLDGSKQVRSRSEVRTVDVQELEPNESAPRKRGRRPARQVLDGSTALAQRAFEKGEFEQAASELARCRADDDPETQLRIGEEMESVAYTALAFGELLVQLELTDPTAPAAELGQRLLGLLEPSLPRLRKRASSEESEAKPKVVLVDPMAPPEPGASPEEIEDFLASRIAPSGQFLRTPFGVTGRKLHLVERDHQGYDIWWAGCFFAVPQGRNPRPALYLIRLLDAVRRHVFGRMAAWMRRMPPRVQLLFKRWFSGSAAARPAVPGVVEPVRVPLLRVRAARTGLEVQQLIPARQRKAPRES